MYGMAGHCPCDQPTVHGSGTEEENLCQNLQETKLERHVNEED